MKSLAPKTLLFVLILNTLNNGCVSVNLAVDKVYKANDLDYKSPAKPFTEADQKSFDKVWQSKTTGNTISLKSECKQQSDFNIHTFENDMLSLLDSAKITSSKAENKSLTSSLEGDLDNTAVKIKVHSFLKKNCLVNLSYVAKKDTFAQEENVFDKFAGDFDEK